MEDSEAVLWSVGAERPDHWQGGPPLSQPGFSWGPSPSITAMAPSAQVPTPAPAGFLPSTEPEPPAWLVSQQPMQAVHAPRLLLAPAGHAYSAALPGMACFVQGGHPELLWHQPVAPASFLGHWQAAAASLQPCLTFVPVAEAQAVHPAQQQHGSSSSCTGTAGACVAACGSGDAPAASASCGYRRERRSPAAVQALDGAPADAPITVEVRQVDSSAPGHMPAATRAPRPCLEGAAAAAVAARLLEVESFEPGPDDGEGTQRAPAARRLLTAAEQLPGGMEWEDPVPVDDLFGPDESWLRDTPGTPLELRAAAAATPTATPPQQPQRPASGPQHPALLQPGMQPALGQGLGLAEAMAALHAVSQHPMMRLLAQPRAAVAAAEAAQPLLGPTGSSPRQQEDAEEAAADTEAALHALGCADLSQGGGAVAVRPASCDAVAPAAPGSIMIWPPSMRPPTGLPPSAFAGAALDAEAGLTGGRRSTRVRRVPLRALGSAPGEVATTAGRSASGRSASSPKPRVGTSGEGPAHVSRAAARDRGAKRAGPHHDDLPGRAARPRLNGSGPAGGSLPPSSDQHQQGGAVTAALLGGTVYPWPLFVAPATGIPHALLPLSAAGFQAASAELPVAASAHQAGPAAVLGGGSPLHTPPKLLKTSAFRGVSWCKRRQLWEAAISINGKRERLGFYRREEAAARAYDLVAAWRNRDMAAARSSRGPAPRRRRRSRSSKGRAGGGEGGGGSGGERDPAQARRVMSQELPLNLPCQLEGAELAGSLEALLEEIRAKAKAALSEAGEEDAPPSPSTPPGPNATLLMAASLHASDSSALPGDQLPAADDTMTALQPAALAPPCAAAAAVVVQAVPVAKSSRYQGVCLCRSNRSRWQAQVTFKRRRHYLGMHGSEEAAARAYDQGAICLLGTGAQTNFPLADYDVASLAALDIADVAASLKALSRGSAAGGRQRGRAPARKRARAAATVPGLSTAIGDSDESEMETETETDTESEWDSE